MKLKSYVKASKMLELQQEDEEEYEVEYENYAA